MIFEAKKIQLIDAKKVPISFYKQTFLTAKMPVPMHEICLHYNDFTQSISAKRLMSNVYFSNKITIKYNNLSDIMEMQRVRALAADHKYAVFVHTNKYIFSIGSREEPLSLIVTDKFQNNGKGQDHLLIEITGDTSTPPIYRNIDPPFKIILATPNYKKE